MVSVGASDALCWRGRDERRRAAELFQRAGEIVRGALTALVGKDAFRLAPHGMMDF